MKKRTSGLVALVVVGLLMLAPGASSQTSHKKGFLEIEHGPTRITNGPIVESLKSDSATIAWSTNVKSGSEIKYGKKSDRLSKSESAPPDGKGLMHRVQLKGLEPSTTYFFVVRSQGESSATRDSSKVLSFTTPALGAEARHNEIPR